MRFYMGTIWLSGRAGVKPVYGMIFRRLKVEGADWIYHFPEMGLEELTSTGDDQERQSAGYAVTAGASRS